MAGLISEAKSPDGVFGIKSSPHFCKSEPTEGSIGISQSPLCPQCKSKKVWRDGSRYNMFDDKIQRWLCKECGHRFSDTEDLQKARNMFERVEMVDTKSLKSKDDIVATNQICVTETKNLVAEQQTIEVPRRNEENRGKIVEHAFWMPTHDKKDPLSGRPHLEYSDKRLAARAAGFPVAYDSGKRLAVSAVEFPVVLANLEAKLDALYDQFERLAAAISV